MIALPARERSYVHDWAGDWAIRRSPQPTSAKSAGQRQNSAARFVHSGFGSAPSASCARDQVPLSALEINDVGLLVCRGSQPCNAGRVTSKRRNEGSVRD
jgi:hypothetical protein